MEDFIAPLLQADAPPSPELSVLRACDPCVLEVLRTNPALKIDDADPDHKESLAYVAGKEAGAALLLMKAFDLLSAAAGRSLYLKLLGGVYAGLLGRVVDAGCQTIARMRENQFK